MTATERETRCFCCDLPEFACGRAAEKRQQAETAKAKAELLECAGWLPSRYPGRCTNCGEPFAAGDPISHPGEYGRSGYLSGCCA